MMRVTIGPGNPLIQIFPSLCAHLALPSYQKTAIFPETRKGNMHSSNESARGWSLSEANVKVSTRSALHDGQDTEKTIWFKRACIRQRARQQLSLAVPTSKKGHQQKMSL